MENKQSSLPLPCKHMERQGMACFISFTKATELLFLYALLSALQDPAAADPPYNVCSNTANYAANSPFESSLNSLFSSLHSNAAVTKFSYTSDRNSSDRAYGMHMCLNYKSTDTCKSCIETASRDVVERCPNKREALVWEEFCQLRYSSENFSGKLDVTGNINQINVLNVPEPETYRSVVNKSLSNLTKVAASGRSTIMYATGDVPFTDTDRLYALVQCAGDLSADDCNTCLQTAIRDILSCCYFSRGARLLSRSCYLRYELYAFYDEGAAEPPVSGGNKERQKGSDRKMRMLTILAIVFAFLLLAILAFTAFCFATKKGTQKKKGEVIRQVQLHNIGEDNKTDFYHQKIQGWDDLKAQDFYIDLKTLHGATDNFSDSNILGQGGFGPVYKGILGDGKEVAVKRLSSNSDQGTEEFINEVLLILKLQHKNLVRLLGFCIDREEKLLVYEFMPNNSLDVILFGLDVRKRVQLTWSKRVHIVNGILKGILYLHEDSRLRIVHRDLKASNVLLDSDMNPKISDFGMARIFAGSESEANTARIVGTYGYMAPEYAMEGLYSVKSDVFSFGVLLLEVITGRRNAGFHQSKLAPSLLAYAWQLWNEGNALELMDPLLIDTCNPEEFLRYIHIGLLCVQEDASDRPTMSSIAVMLKGETINLQQPERPAFAVGRFTDHYETKDNNFSANCLTVSDILPR